ncbi:hypothetical protein HNR23_004130 [Nocardiopsis mwathae]|uniref:Uncharacterized protein n=1 Tax=Nocardiopsis mwathae TaxID=1472723 RepID=A0A7W9YKX4_9ACTN|nr:hypothetical protein [Nocardiopsis mwathae]MBB6174070.1 hypothetical protein [Nocardiopsis mwathae]
MSTTFDIHDLDPDEMNIVDSADGREVFIELGDRTRFAVPTTGPGAVRGAAAMQRLSDLAHEAFHRATWRAIADATGGDT